ncbi:Cysteine desulfurase [compost metagenome]
MTESALLLESLTSQLMIELHQRGLRPTLIGPVSGRLPGHLSLRFPGVDALDLLDRLLPKLSISTGSACSAGELRASRVLRALGLTEQEASEGLRFSLGRTSTPQEVSLMAEYVSDVVKDLEC